MPAVPPTPTLHILWWLPRLAFLLFVATVAALLWFLEKTEQEEQRTTLISDVLWLEQNLRFLLSHNEELLGRFDPQRIDLPGIFDAHAQALIGSSTGVAQVIWLDQHGKTVHALPAPTQSTMIGEGQGPMPSPALSRLAHSLGQAVYGPTYPIVNDDWQFEMHVPVFRGSQFAGTAVGIYSIRRLLEDTIPWWLAERYRIRILDQSGLQLGMRSKVSEIAPGIEYQIQFDPPGHGLILHAMPFQVPKPLSGRLISFALLVLAMLVLASLWALRRGVQQRLATESALQSEVAFRKAMEDSLKTGLRARNLEGQITYVNPAFCQMVGWPAEALIGRMPPMPYWADEYLDETRSMHELVLSGLAPSEGFEIKFKRRNGETFDVLIHEAPLIDSHGLHTGWMGSVVDITERKRTAELGRQQEERLQASARLITMGEMASSLAHELSQPLSAISSYAAGCRNLIATGSDYGEIDGALAKCQEQAQRAGKIIRRIYEFVRRHEPKTEACHPESLLTDLVLLLEADARRQKVRIVKDIPPNLPVIQADSILLGQALLNLMKNGIDSMRLIDESQRSLTIRAELGRDNQLHISIEDCGTGISGDDAAHLYEPFYTTKAEGLGVGLNICRSVVEGHHGRLWFEPRPGGGTIFHISLPVTPE